MGHGQGGQWREYEAVPTFAVSPFPGVALILLWGKNTARNHRVQGERWGAGLGPCSVYLKYLFWWKYQLLISTLVRVGVPWGAIKTHIPRPLVQC